MTEPKYFIRAGMYLNDIRGANFIDITTAMDFADTLYTKGFDYVEVVDENLAVQYTVEQISPLTPHEREARKHRARDFALEWNTQHRLETSMTKYAKQLQDEAYETYKYNINYSNDLDVMMGCYGQLDAVMDYFHRKYEAFNV